MRLADKVAVAQPPLHQCLRHFAGQAGNVHFSDQRQIDVAGAVHALVARHLGHIEN